jgi:hypothetical protein
MGTRPDTAPKKKSAAVSARRHGRDDPDVELHRPLSVLRFAAVRAGCTRIFAALGLLMPVAAAAQEPPPRSAAETLFDSARALMVAGRYAEACPKLQLSESIDPGIGTEFNLARCWELSGRLASAYAVYQRVLSETHVAGQASREAVVEERVAAIEPRLAYAILNVGIGRVEPRFELRLDGALVDSVRWGTLVPVDPGDHTVTAAAPGARPWMARFAIEREGQRVTVDVPLLTPSAPVPASPSASAPLVEAPVVKEAPSQRGRVQRIGALALGALGAGGVAVGGYYGVQAWSLASQASKYCSGSTCSSHDGVTLRNDSRTFGNVSTGAFIASGVLLAAAVVLWFTAPSDSARSARGVASMDALSDLGVVRFQ